IMTVHLSKDLEQIVHEAVRAGLYAREDDVIRDALIRLKQTMPGDTEMAHQDAKGAKSPAEEKPLIDALNQRLLAAGLVIQLPDPAEDIDDDDPDDQPIEIVGEPLSETIIRERRWRGVYFVDSSAFVKRYVREAGTSWPAVSPGRV